MSSFIEEIAEGKLPSVNKKTILLVGGVGVAGFVLFQFLGRGQGNVIETSSPVVVADKGMPTNSADVQAQLQNFAGMTEDYVNQSITQAMNALNSDTTQLGNSLTQDINKAATELFNDNQKYQESLLRDVTKEFDAIRKQYDSRFEELDKPVSSPPVLTPAKPITTGTLTTGTFASQKDADLLRAQLTKTYGATDAKVVNEGGSYRVVGTFEDQARAQKVGTNLVDTKRLGVYYAK